MEDSRRAVRYYSEALAAQGHGSALSRHSWLPGINRPHAFAARRGPPERCRREQESARDAFDALAAFLVIIKPIFPTVSGFVSGTSRCVSSGGGGHVCEAQDSTGGMLGMATLREVTSILYRVERAHWAYQDDVLVRNPALQDLSFQTFTTLLVSQVPDHLLVLRLFRMHSPRVDICLVL